MTDTTEPRKPTNIVEALSLVMDEIGAVRKAERNEGQGFNFRGIDAVVNACSPAFRKHGVVVVPRLMKITHSTVEVGTRRTLMGHVAVEVEYTFYGPGPFDFVSAVTPGEAMDSGDKATAKAMSVAFRTALLQTLALPTDEADPDATVYERSAAPPEHTTIGTPSAEAAPLLEEIRSLAAWAGIPPADVLNRFAAKHDGLHITRAAVAQLQPVLDELRARKAAHDKPEEGTE